VSFLAKLQRGREILEQQRRLSVRALGRELETTGDELDEIVEELVDVQQVARREGKVLLWVAATPSEAGGRTAVTAPDTTSKVSGARKVVTVVFADLIGSTSLHERLDPESVSRLMDRYHRAVRVPIEAHGGTVVHLLGDGVMCAFGVPQVAEDDAIRAVRAAVAVQEAFRRFAREESAIVGTTGLRVAVNTGEVVISDEYAAGIGDPLNVAARLQQEARDGDVLIGEATERVVRDQVTLERFGTFALKGRAETVTAYRVVSLERPAGVPSTPFIGRDAELARLLAVYDTAVATPAARLAMILGSPGLGKSRLVAEVARRLRDRATVLLAHCDPTGSATFAPLADALRLQLGVDDAATAETVHAAAMEAVRTEDAPRIAAGIAAVLGGTPGSPEETFFVVRRFFGALAMTRPVVLVIDDLQWAEPLLLDLVEHLIQWSAGVPLLVLGAARPELRDARSSLATPGPLVADAVTLAGLDAGAATRLAASVVGAEELPAAIAGRVLATSEGNPLFVGELVRMLVHDGALKREGDRWTAGVALAQLEMPPTIQALLAARIERLRPEDRTVLERAAVVGRQFSRAAVAHLLRRETTDLDGRLEALRRSELIEPDTGWFLGEPALRFHHVLVRDAAYRRLLKNTRAELHARFADWLEGRAGDAVEHEETLGWHLEQAHQNLRELGPVDERGHTLGERAARHLAASGRRALARDDLSLAAGLLGRALDRLDPDDSARADLTLDWCEALLAAGDVGPAAPAIAELARFAGESPRVRAWHTCFAGQLAALTDPQTLRATADAVAAAAEALAAAGDAAGEAKAHSVHAIALARLGRVGACEAALDRALAAARRANDRRRSNAVLASAPLAALWGPSPVTRASGRCLDVVRVLRITQGAPAVEAVALRCQGVLEALRGRAEAARRMLASSRRMVEELGITQRLLEADVFAGLVDLLEGDAPAAERSLRVAYDGLREHGLRIDAAQAAALLGRALLALGRIDEAEALSHESEALAGDDLRAAVAWRGVRGEALARRGEHATAVELARAAVGIAGATDALLDHADARLALAATLRAAGRSAEAAAEEQRAIELWDAKGATLLAERARRGIGRVLHEDRVPEVRARAAPSVRRWLQPNAASAFTARLDAAIAARDTDALATMFSDEMEVVTHPTGTIVDREGAFTTWRMLLRGENPTCRHEPLATLGDSLVLCRMSVSGSRFGGARFDVGAYERTEIVVIEVDSRGRERWGEHFTDDRLADAVVRLYERYAELLPDGPERKRAEATARSVAAVPGPMSFDRLGTIFAPDAEFDDHRPVGLPSGRGRDAILVTLRSLLELTGDPAIRVDDVLGLRPDAFLVRATSLGTLRAGGGAFERSILLLSTFDADGLVTHWEFFSPERDAEALARFDEMAATRPASRSDAPRRRVRPNAATANAARIDAAWATHDDDAFRAVFADGAKDMHHPTGVVYDARAGLATWRALSRAEDPTFHTEPLASLGESLALCRITWSASGLASQKLDVGAYEGEEVILIEVDGRGQRTNAEMFAADRLGDAVTRLYERYAELLPDGPARRRAAATARALAVNFGPLDLDRMIAWSAPDTVLLDHRMVGFGSAHGIEEVRTALRALFEVADDVTNRVEDVLDLRADALLLRMTNFGTEHTGGGTYERPYLMMWTYGAGGLVTRAEQFDIGREAEALARFDELTAAPTRAVARRKRAVRPNAATANAAAIDAVLAARDPQAPAQLDRLISDGSEVVDHINGITFDRRGALATWDALMRVPDLTSRYEPLATLGDSLAVLRRSLSASGVRRGRFDVGPYEDERIDLVETDSTGRRSRSEAFHVHRLGDAIARLYAWHADLLPDGPAHLRAVATARSIAMLVGPVDVDRGATAVAHDIAFHDHKTLGWGSVRGAEAFLGVVRSLLDVSSNTTLRIDDVLGIRPDAILARCTNSGTDRVSGGAYDRQALVVCAFDADGLVSRWEQFDPHRDDEALACFEKLTDTTSPSPVAAPSRVAERRVRRVRPNAATANAARIHAAIVARDASAIAADIAEHVEVVDHTWGATYDREGFLATWRSLATTEDRAHRIEPLATLGDSLVLYRAWVSASGFTGRKFDVGPYEIENVILGEVDGEGRRAANELFAADRLGDAIVRLYERYADLLPEGPARARAAATARSVAACTGLIDLERYASACAADVEHVDHRTIGFGSTRGVAPFLHGLRTLIDASPDAANRFDDILGMRPDGFVVRITSFGTARMSGGSYERPMLLLWVFGADGLVRRIEQFDPERDAEALARFDELTGEPPAARLATAPVRSAERHGRRVRANAATATGARFDAAMAARAANALPPLFADDFELTDHTTGITYDREGVLSSLRLRLSARDPTARTEQLATLGDSLALSRWSMSASGFSDGTVDVGAFEQELISLTEVDAHGRRRRAEMFATNRLGDAIVRLYERHADLLPDGPARARAAATAGSVAAMLAAPDLDRMATAFAPSIEWDDERTVGLGSVHGAEAVERAIRALFELVEASVYRVDDIIALRSDTLLVRWTHSGIDRASGGAIERQVLVLWVFGADGLLTRWVQSDVHRDAEMLSRFDELTGETPRLATARLRISEERTRRVRANAATTNAARVDAALAAGDGEILSSLLAADAEIEERTTGVTYGREGLLATWRALLKSRDPSFRHEPIATLGESLALCHLSFSASGFMGRTFDVAAHEREDLLAIEVDANGRRRWMECFAADRLGDAIVRLYERYGKRLPDGPRRARAAATARSVAFQLGSLDLDRMVSGMTSDIDLRDHRTVGVGSVRGADRIRDALGRLFEIGNDLANRVDGVLGLCPNATLFHMTNSGTDRLGGGTSERPFLVAWVFGPDGRIAHIEQFDVGHEAEALARFDELTAELPATPCIENAATRATVRFAEAWKARDWERIEAMYPPEFHMSDRRTLMHMELGREQHLASLRTLFEMTSARIASELLATRGERLALSRQLFGGSDRAAGPFEVEYLSVLETNDRGERIAIVMIDPDDLDAGYAELDARFAAGEAASHRAAWDAMRRWSDAFRKRDWERLASAFAPDFILEDRRRLALLGTQSTPEEFVFTIRALADLAPDAVLRFDHVLAFDERGSLYVGRYSGAAGDTFEIPFVTVATFASDGRYRRLYAYDLDQLDAARALYDDLGTKRPAHAIENAATRSLRRSEEAWESRDWEHIVGLFAPTFRMSDRRAMSHLELDRVQHVASLSTMFGMASCRFFSQVLATRGERLALHRQRFEGTDRNVGPSDVEYLLVTELNDRSERVAMVAFDPDDLDAAYTELDDRYAAGEALPYAAAWASWQRFGQSLAAHDWEQWASMVVPDFVLEDHRLLGLGTLRSRDDVAKYDRGLVDLRPDARLRLRHVLAFDDRRSLAVAEWFGDEAKGAFELPFVAIGVRSPDGRVQQMHLYDLDRLEEARACYEKLVGAVPSPRLENAATRSVDRVVAALDARDWDRVAAEFAPDFRGSDRRTLVGHLEIDRDQQLHAFRFDGDLYAVRITHETLATRGERLALFRLLTERTGGDIGTSEAEWLGLNEVNEHGQRVATVSFDLDDLDAATAEMDARYLAGEAAPFRCTYTRVQTFGEAIAARDWDRVAAQLAPDFVVQDHRPLGWPTMGIPTYVDALKTLVDLAPDARIRADHVVLSERTELAITTLVGTREGGAFEDRRVGVFEWDAQGMIRRLDFYALDQLATARTRFDALSTGGPAEHTNAAAEAHPNDPAAPQTATRNTDGEWVGAPLRIPPNAATRAVDRHYAAAEAQDWSAVRAVVAPAAVFDDRRRGLRTTGDADLFLSNTEYIFSRRTRPQTRTLLATAGERLALHHILWTAGDRAARIEIEALHLWEVDPDGRLVACVSFDPDERRAAHAELLDRYARSAEMRAVPAAYWEYVRAIGAHDLERVRAALPDDFVYDDHRRTGPGRLEGADRYVAWLATLFEQSADATNERLYRVASGPHGIVTVVRTTGTLPEGGEFETVTVCFDRFQGGRFIAFERFELEDLEVARGQCDALPPDGARPAVGQR
jgi:class 3 adenylate cyclase/tetratricopeptide (TPR) repeat protein